MNFINSNQEASSWQSGDVTFFHQFKVDVGNKIHTIWIVIHGKWFYHVRGNTAASNDAAPHFGRHWHDKFRNKRGYAGRKLCGKRTFAGIAELFKFGATVTWSAQKSASHSTRATRRTRAGASCTTLPMQINARPQSQFDFGSARDLTAGLFEFKFNAVDGVGAIGTLA